jgi:hypothetical protein
MAHNANYVAWSSKNITRNEYYKYINSIFLTPRTKAFIEECRLGKRELFPGFDKKFECSHKTNGLQYYRKMSTAEFNSFSTDKYKKSPLLSACDHVNKDLYRVWMSSSYKKCIAFGNEKATDAGDVIVRFRFSKALLTLPLDFQPHQKPGVQDDVTILAVHREGFATFGNLDPEEFVYVREHNFDHNIGICRAKVDRLNEYLVGFEKMK